MSSIRHQGGALSNASAPFVTHCSRPVRPLLGLILVVLAGVAELLLRAGGILVGVGLGGSLQTALFAVATVLAIVVALALWRTRRWPARVTCDILSLVTLLNGRG